METLLLVVLIGPGIGLGLMAVWIEHVRRRNRRRLIERVMWGER